MPALREYSQLLLNDHDSLQALPWLEQLHMLEPNNDTYTFQLGYLYYLSGDWQKAKSLFKGMLPHVTGQLRVQVLQALNAMASYLPYYQYHGTVEWFATGSQKERALVGLPFITSMQVVSKTTTSKMPKTNPLDSFYLLKTKDDNAAHSVIQQIIIRQPNNIQALKEAAYLAVRQGHRSEAINYFTRVYHLTYQPDIAMQLAYLYDQINDKPRAYQYFKLATAGHDKVLALSAKNALTNLRGLQTKALSSPYFSELFFSPFSQTRFGLTVVPLYVRLGMEQNNRLLTKEYVFFRRTRDNRSANLGELSQIFEDNVQITGVGGQLTPFKRLPMVGFVEVGEAYDLVYRNRNRWRGDLRAGLISYQEFGAAPAYFEKLKLSHHYYSNWYGDATYFSRYNNNVIGLLRTHQGIRLLQYHSSMLNVYATARVIADTERVFYNNVAEVGPGISFIPNNRFNLELRYERVNGVYLPAGGSFNPYGKYYINQFVQLLFYVKL